MRINARILQRKNAKYIYHEWEDNYKNARAVQLRVIPDLIREGGKFDYSHEDLLYNLSHITQMQYNTAERDERYGKTEKR